jgi:hypothetical protein
MARKPIPQDVFDRPFSGVEGDYSAAIKEPSAKNLSPLQLACNAIAAKRQGDSYTIENTADHVKYSNGAKRLVVSVSKLAEKDVANRDAKTLEKANSILAAYKNFTEADVMSGADLGFLLFVVTKDGEKYRYDLTKNVLV